MGGAAGWLGEGVAEGGAPGPPSPGTISFEWGLLAAL